MGHTIESLDCIQAIKEMTLSKIEFVRGLGIIENRLLLSFSMESETLDIEVETNFRARNREKVFLNYNDLYLDFQRREMSVRKYRSQTNIEKSYLYQQIEFISKELKGTKPKKIQFFEYGDIFISFRQGIVIEIFNDTHLENATLYRVIHTSNGLKRAYEYRIKNNAFVLEEVDWDSF